MEQREAMAALDRALVKLSEQAEKDDDMALAMEVVQAERAEAEYDGEFGGGAEPREPVRKEIVAGASAGVALIVVWVLTQFGLSVPPDVQAAIALLVGAAGGYLKGESVWVG